MITMWTGNMEMPLVRCQETSLDPVEAFDRRLRNVEDLTVGVILSALIRQFPGISLAAGAHGPCIEVILHDIPGVDLPEARRRVRTDHIPGAVDNAFEL